MKNSGIIACFQVLLVCTRRHVLRNPLLYARALKTSPGPLLKFERGVSFYYLTILWFIGYFSRDGYSLLTKQKLKLKIVKKKCFFFRKKTPLAIHLILFINVGNMSKGKTQLLFLFSKNINVTRSLSRTKIGVMDNEQTHKQIITNTHQTNRQRQ